MPTIAVAEGETGVEDDVAACRRQWRRRALVEAAQSNAMGDALRDQGSSWHDRAAWAQAPKAQ
jgi:hypothetical protein